MKLLIVPLLLFAQLAQASCDEAKLSESILKTLFRYHAAPIPYEASSGKAIIERHIDAIDPYGVLFSKQDIAALHTHFPALHDTLSVASNHCAYLDTISLWRNERRQQLRQWEAGWLEASPSWKPGSEWFAYWNDRVDRGHDAKERKSRVQDFIRFRFLLQVAEMDTSGNLVEWIGKNESLIKERIAKQLGCAEELTEEDHRNYITDKFYSAICRAFDPHSDFFDSQRSDAFFEQLSSENKSFGLVFSEVDGGGIEVESVLPGSRTWREALVQESDELIALEIDGLREDDFDCLAADEINGALAASVSDEAVIKLRKASGKLVEYRIYRSTIRNTDNLVNGYVLPQGERNWGYVALPSFFSSDEWLDKGAANELGKTVLKLKKESIDGLILDLRYNGGGDLMEATELVGLFIDVGPIGMQAWRDERPSLIKEMQRGYLYDGPLIVLVNGFSASASEVVAGALQNHGRALIVGQSTYGKGTAQAFVPLFPESGSPEELMIKMTTGLLYRIDGNTHQGHGVQPDVVLPSPYSRMEIKESFLPAAIPLEKIDRRLRYKPWPSIPAPLLAEKSAERIEADPYFMALQSMRNQWPSSGVRLRLTPELFAADFNALTEFYAQLEEAQSEAVSIEIEQLAASAALLQMDRDLERIQQMEMERLQTDPWLLECMNVLSDWINLKP